MITSPPYETQISDEAARYKLYNSGGKGQDGSYTQPAAVITSPPYDQTHIGTPDEQRLMRAEAHNIGGLNYGEGNSNIGNLRGEKYWESMRQVYGECRRVLAPGGLLVLVVKGYQHDKKYVDLPQQTVDCCQALGFTFVERWERELWGLSFWRVLQATDKVEKLLGLQGALNAEDIKEINQSIRVANGTLDPRLRYESVLVLRR